MDAISRYFFQLDAKDEACMGGSMKLSARQKYDHRDLDRGEAQLIRIGHALWRDRLKLGDTVAEREGINTALESVWQAKREYRVELAKKRALRFSQYLDDYKPDSRFFPKPLDSLRKESIDAKAKDNCG